MKGFMRTKLVWHLAAVVMIAAAVAVPLSSSTAYAHTALSYRVRGWPSVSADFINRVLDSSDSPAAGKGQALYDDGVAYGIDPVFALAFFMHESTFGTRGVATVTHSLGNIRCTPGYPSCYKGYRLYSTWEEGFEDWYQLIRYVYMARWGLTTVDRIIPVYAPARENNVRAYIRAVKYAVTTWRRGQVIVS